MKFWDLLKYRGAHKTYLEWKPVSILLFSILNDKLKKPNIGNSKCNNWIVKVIVIVIVTVITEEQNLSGLLCKNLEYNKTGYNGVAENGICNCKNQLRSHVFLS